MTARRLVLVRHAKAEPAARDRDRALSDRGRRDAGAIGRVLRTRGLLPDQVVVSPARRALQTWEYAAAELSSVPTVVVDDRIYANTVDDLFAVVHDTGDEVRTLAVVGHNPSLQAFLLEVGEDDALLDAAREHFPTAAVAAVDVDVGWYDVGRAGHRLSLFEACRG